MSQIKGWGVCPGAGWQPAPTFKQVRMGRKVLRAEASCGAGAGPDCSLLETPLKDPARAALTQSGGCFQRRAEAFLARKPDPAGRLTAHLPLQQWPQPGPAVPEGRQRGWVVLAQLSQAPDLQGLGRHPPGFL